MVEPWPGERQSVAGHGGKPSHRRHRVAARHLRRRGRNGRTVHPKQSDQNQQRKFPRPVQDVVAPPPGSRDIRNPLSKSGGMSWRPADATACAEQFLSIGGVHSECVAANDDSVDVAPQRNLLEDETRRIGFIRRIVVSVTTGERKRRSGRQNFPYIAGAVGSFSVGIASASLRPNRRCVQKRRVKNVWRPLLERRPATFGIRSDLRVHRGF